MAVDYGSDFIGTVRDPGASGYRDTGDFGPSAWSVGIGYAKTLSDRFSFGAQAKLVGQEDGGSHNKNRVGSIGTSRRSDCNRPTLSALGEKDAGSVNKRNREDKTPASR